MMGMLDSGFAHRSFSEGEMLDTRSNQYEKSRVIIQHKTQLTSAAADNS